MDQHQDQEVSEAPAHLRRPQHAAEATGTLNWKRAAKVDVHTHRGLTHSHLDVHHRVSSGAPNEQDSKENRSEVPAHAASTDHRKERPC